MTRLTLSSMLENSALKRAGQATCFAMLASFGLAAHGQSLTVTKVVTAKQQADATAYWTRSRISGAPAMALPLDRRSGGVDATAQTLALASTGPVGSTPSGTAQAGADAVARAAFAKDWAALGATSAGEAAVAAAADGGLPAGTPSIYTSYDVNVQSALWQIYPHRWMGRLTFTTPSGGSSCSATAISNNNFVTAAHCVYDTTANRFYSAWVFVPAYRNGAAPFGVFTATVCSVPTAWVNLTGAYNINTWARHDVAVCTVGRNAANQTLNQVVGFAGRLWNAGNSQLVFNSGYPQRTYTQAVIANGPTQYLRSCTAETFLQTTETLGMGCNWGPGISGGSWLVGYKPFIAGGQVNSVNSGLFVGQQNMFGARFNSNNIVVVCTARGC